MRLLSAFRRLVARAYLTGKKIAEESSYQDTCAILGQNAVVTERGEITNTSGDRNLITIGDHSWIEGRLLSYPTGGVIRIGAWCYIGQRTDIWSMKSVVLGDRVFVSHNVNIHDTNSHSVNPEKRHAHFRHLQAKGSPWDWSDLPGVRSEPIVIEDDVWIGFGCSIFKGVRIGSGSVVAAGSIVTKDIPPKTFYRCRFEPVISPLEQD